MFFPYRDNNPTGSFPLITVSLIAINVLVYLFQLAQGEQLIGFVYAWGAIPGRITGLIDSPIPGTPPAPLTMISSMFMHSGPLHLAGNMWYLWLFGDNVEEAMGSRRFILFYLLGGLIATGTHVLTQPGSAIPLVGASGAISAVMGAYIYLYPKATIRCLLFVLILITTVNVPAVLFIGGWFLLQVFYSGGGGQVAWYAHIGGFAAGLALQFVLVRRKGNSLIGKMRKGLRPKRPRR